MGCSPTAARAGLRVVIGRSAVTSSFYHSLHPVTLRLIRVKMHQLPWSNLLGPNHISFPSSTSLPGANSGTAM
ncbi:hypothetical protein N7468_002026 [Penicillium chermesinum]|uniref:Uncharacterized protein n=1 Tax=Penicillium chermesinum TaxID=63820 RepID=A0A9W9TXZ1_9EURO|nr:uncharacterized protein N7468_002026 [Penicillium chermesinum]KAJ5247043.1 hypothetical protein N7468_002026 [Penicillium chermesinum]